MWQILQIVANNDYFIRGDVCEASEVSGPLISWGWSRVKSVSRWCAPSAIIGNGTHKVVHLMMSIFLHYLESQVHAALIIAALVFEA